MYTLSIAVNNLVLVPLEESRTRVERWLYVFCGSETVLQPNFAASDGPISKFFCLIFGNKAVIYGGSK